MGNNLIVWIVTFILNNSFLRITICFNGKGVKNIKVVTHALTFNEYLKLDSLQLNKFNYVNKLVKSRNRRVSELKNLKSRKSRSRKDYCSSGQEIADGL